MTRPLVLLVFAAFASFGCATLQQADEALYSTTEKVAPTNPVTGRPTFNIVSQEQEIASAQASWEKIAAAANTEGIAIDPPGPHLRQMRIVFYNLVAVAHRQDLPWEIHLVDTPMNNAMTPGGGMVFVFEGLYGGLVPEGDDDALAAVLAHEIAHVTLFHPPSRATWSSIAPLMTKSAADPFYKAAFTTEQEAEADKLAALYMALAGYDPMAATRVWERAHRRLGSNPAKQSFLHTHPLNAERAAATRSAAIGAAQYRIPGQQNPDWEAVLADNVLLPPSQEIEYQPGAGVGRALQGAAEALRKHQAAEAEESRRKAALQQLNSSVQIVRVWEQPTADGQVGVFFDVYNGSGQAIQGLTIHMHYFSGQQLLGTDPSCQVNLQILPGHQARGGCYKRLLPGTTGMTPQIAQIHWQ